MFGQCLTPYSEITIFGLSMVANVPLKKVIWVGSSRRDLRAFSRSCSGPHRICPLCCAERRQTPRCESAQRLWRRRRRGSRQRLPRRHVPRDTYRAISEEFVCAPRLSEEVEDRTGDATARHGFDSATVARSGRDRQRDRAMTKSRYETGSRNGFQAPGRPNAEDPLVRARLVYKIDRLLKERGLIQAEAAKLFGVRQPDVS